jgi:putative transposase
MTSNTVVGLYARLGIDQSHSRPHVSNDNPYSEAQFKTLKYVSFDLTATAALHTGR